MPHNNDLQKALSPPVLSLLSMSLIDKICPHHADLRKVTRLIHMIGFAILARLVYHLLVFG